MEAFDSKNIFSKNIEILNERAKTEEDYFEANLCEKCSYDNKRQETFNDIPSPMNPNNIEHLSQNMSSQTDVAQEMEQILNPHVGMII